MASAPIDTPLRVLWAAYGTVARCFDVPAPWRECARHTSGRALDCGHTIAEERLQELLDEMFEFFKE